MFPHLQYQSPGLDLSCPFLLVGGDTFLPLGELGADDWGLMFLGGVDESEVPPPPSSFWIFFSNLRSKLESLSSLSLLACFLFFFFFFFLLFLLFLSSWMCSCNAFIFTGLSMSLFLSSISLFLRATNGSSCSFLCKSTWCSAWLAKREGGAQSYSTALIWPNVPSFSKFFPIAFPNRYSSLFMVLFGPSYIHEFAPKGWEFAPVPSSILKQNFILLKCYTQAV